MHYKAQFVYLALWLMWLTCIIGLTNHGLIEIIKGQFDTRLGRAQVHEL